MTGAQAIDDAVQAVRRSQRTISDVCQRRADGWRHEVVRLRRDLADRMASLCGITADMRGSQDPATQAFCGRVSALHSALAMHQASWPAVALDPDDAQYLESAKELRHAYDELERSVAQMFRGALPKNGDVER